MNEMENNFTLEDAKRIGNQLSVNWIKIDPEQFMKGLETELEHGLVNPLTNVTNDNLLITGKIALAHLNEYPDYYKRLEIMEKEAQLYWNVI